MSLIDGLIFGVFILAALVSGWKSKNQASEGLNEYFLAGRSLTGWSAGLSMAATQFAADTPLLVTGLVATRGLFSLWQLWIFVFAFLLFAYLLAPCWRRAMVLTDAELTEKRYDGKLSYVLRITKSIYFGLLFNCIVLAWVLLAATKIAEPFLVWNEWLPAAVYLPFLNFVQSAGISFASDLTTLAPAASTANNLISIFAILLFTMTYSTLGGLRAVVKTDIMQLGIMLGGSALYAYVIIREVGGFSQLRTQLETLYPESSSNLLNFNQLLSFDFTYHPQMATSFLILLGLQWLIQVNSDGTGYLAQRGMACKSDKEAKKAGVVFSITQILLRSLIWLPLTLGLLVLYPLVPGTEVNALDREVTFITGMKDFLPVGLLGIMFTAMFAALTSTVDSHLNWGSSYVTNDLFKSLVMEKIFKRSPSKRLLVWVARLSNVLILGTALVFCAHLESIQQAWQICLMLGSGVGVVLVLRWLWWRIDAVAELTAIVVSLIASVFAFYTIDDSAERILLVALISSLASILVTFRQRHFSIDVIKSFYQQVRPPGFWPVQITGDIKQSRASSRHFYAMSSAAFLTGVSILSLLAGIGGLLIQSPAPQPLAEVLSPTMWQLLLVSVGIVCIYPAFKLGFSESPEAAPESLEIEPHPSDEALEKSGAVDLHRNSKSGVN